MNTRKLLQTLDDAYGHFHRPEYLATDPLAVPHRYAAAADREVMALISAAFASGNIKAILAVLDAIAGVLGRNPATFLRETPPKDLRGRFAGIYHRWVREEDIEVLMALLGEALRRHGTLGELWRSVDDPEGENTLGGLTRFVEALGALPINPLERRGRVMRRAGGALHSLSTIDTILLTSPAKGSACKRMHLFLRWVARPEDGVDLGLWTEFLSPARLVMPVDVHVLRQAMRLGMTTRKIPDQKAALEITKMMKKVCPEDPTRYDFSLVRVGINR